MSHVLVALYDTRGAAESARAEVAGLGLSDADVTIHGTGSEAGTGTVTGGRPFWEDIGETLFPQRDRYLLDEHTRRGGWQVVARVPDDMADRAHDVLERHDPIDLDERAETWRSGGWREPGAGTTAAAGPALGEVPPPPPPEEDPRTVGGLGESIAYAAEPLGGGTIRRPGAAAGTGAGAAGRRARVRRYGSGGVS